MILHRWSYACLGAVAGILCVPCQSFSVGAGPKPSRTSLYASDGGDGGTEWIKKAMGSENHNSGQDPPPSEPDFTQNEINDMEQLIFTLSKETDDDKRREKLAGLLDKELSEANAEGVTKEEVPRFAQLFQISLDNVGEQVQTAAREAALEKQQSDSGLVKALEGDAANESESGDGGDMIERLKSPEELQLWALIDMLVQSKTRVKLYMGSLGSKGEFR